MVVWLRGCGSMCSHAGLNVIVCDCVWLCVWFCVVVSGFCWDVCSCVWCCEVVYACVCLFFAYLCVVECSFVCGSVWICTFLCGCVWFYVVVCGSVW